MKRSALVRSGLEKCQSGSDRDSVEPINCLYSDSLAFAERELLLARQSAHRAIAHLDRVGELAIPELKILAHQTAAEAVTRYKRAIGKRAFEIRQLL